MIEIETEIAMRAVLSRKAVPARSSTAQPSRMERSRRPRRRNRLWIARLHICPARRDAGGCPVALR